jgi:hypothetical protein
MIIRERKPKGNLAARWAIRDCLSFFNHVTFLGTSERVLVHNIYMQAIMRYGYSTTPRKNN